MSAIPLKKSPVLSSLGETSITDFFSLYWQQKHLFARQALPNFVSPLDAEEIAGLCLEEDVNARLVVQTQNHWQLTHSPLPADTFSRLPESMWSILVQHLDSLDPAINTLLDRFRFIPNWRLDDIMVSYASDGGGVGPHFDYYDVFLLQAQGKRRWRIGQTCDSTSALIPNQPMKVLESFQTHADYTVEAGDLLYIPAGTAHWGEAIGESITYSIGFRAPSHSEFILDYSQDLAADCREDQRYVDRQVKQHLHPGLISEDVIAQLSDIYLNIGRDKQKLGRWLGEYSTRLKHDISGMYPMLSLAQLQSDTACCIHPHARVAYTKEETNYCCFINGASAPCSEALAIALSEKCAFSYSQFSPADRKVLEDLSHSHLLISIDTLNTIN